MQGRFSRRAVSILLISTAGYSFADKISVEQIVQRHIQALGGRDNIETVRSTVTRGEYREGTFTIPGAYVAKMRPYYRTICDPRQKLGEVCEGYDGSAWEWYAEPGIVLRVVGAAAAATRHGTEFIDSLVDYKSRGTQIALVDTDVFDGKPAYKLHVTLADGFEKDLFIDQHSFLIIGDRRSALIHAFGEPVHSENRISDYRSVNGVLFPFLIKEVEIATGKELNRFSVQSIEINPELYPG